MAANPLQESLFEAAKDLPDLGKTTSLEPAPAPSNVTALPGLEEAGKELAQERDANLISGLQTAQEVDPRLYQEAAGIAQRQGLDLQDVIKDPNGFRKLEERQQIEDILNKNPITRQALVQVPGAAVLARDEVANLTGIERFGRIVSRRYQIGDAMTTVGLLTDKEFRGEALTPDEQKQLDEASKVMGDAGDPVNDPGFLEQMFGGASEMVPQLLQQAKMAGVGGAAGALIGGAAGALAGPAGIVPGASFGLRVGAATGGLVTNFELMRGLAIHDLRQVKDLDGKPIDPRIINWVGNSIGVINSALDAAGLWAAFGKPVTTQMKAKVMTSLIRQPAVREFIIGNIEEGVTEAMQDVVQDFFTDVAKKAQGGEFFYNSPGERAAQYGETFLQTVMSVAPIQVATGAGAHGVRRLAERASVRRAADLDKERENVIGNAQKMELPNVNPQAADRVVQEMAVQSGTPRVAVSPEAFDELLQSGIATPASLEETLPGLVARIDAAREQGTDVELDFAEWHNHLLRRPEIADSIYDHTRFEDGDFSIREAQVIGEADAALQAEADMQKAGGPEAQELPAYQRIVDQTVEQLVRTGQSEEVATANAQTMASFFTVMARRAGLDADAWFAQRGPEILRVLDERRRTQDEITQNSEALNAFLGQTPWQGQVWYHGTAGRGLTSDRQNFSEFRPNDRGLIFVSPDAGRAEDFASADRPNEKGARIYPLYVRAENPFDFENDAQVDRVVEAVDLNTFNADAPQRPARSKDAIRQRLLNGEWKAIENRETLRALRELGHDALFVSEGGEKNLAVFDPSQLKSATGNRGTFDRSNPNILAQAATELRQDTGLLKREFGLENNEQGNVTTRNLAEAIERWSRARHEEIPRNDRSEAAAQQIAGYMAEEVASEVNRDDPNSAVGWYTEKWQRAIDKFGSIWPELLTDKSARDMFTILFAVFSDGQKVFANARFAAAAYQEYRNTGRMPTEVAGSRNFAKNLARINTLIDQFGADGMHEFLLQRDTVKNLKQRAAAEGLELDTKYTVDMELPFSAVFLGPKLGAFYANLMGDTGYLTMDRWWNRTFNRYRGQLVPEVSPKGMARMKELLGFPADATDDAIVPDIIRLRNSYEAKDFKNGTEQEKAANTLWKQIYLELEDAPFNATDRKFQVRTAQIAQEQLREQGIDMTIADIQAVLWYYEKRLYAELGVRPSGDVSYEEAAAKIVEDYSGGPARPDLEETPEGQAGNPSEDLGVETNELFQRGPANFTQQIADGYKEQAGIAKPPLRGKANPDQSYLRRVADWLESADHQPDDPAVAASYAALGKESLAQYQYMLDQSGVVVEAYDGEGEPYANSTEMMRDVEENKHLWFFRTENGFGETGMPDGHPMLQPTQYMDNKGRPLLLNDVFRIIHDYFGHTQNGFQFGPVGEYNAFQEHARMFSDEAVPALAAETLAQNAWVNFGPHLRRPDGSIPRPGDPDYISQRDRPFAQQKATIVPQELLASDPNPDAAGRQIAVRNQEANASIEFREDQQPIIRLFRKANLSSFQHEAAHLYLRAFRELAIQENAPADIKADWETIKEYTGIKGDRLTRAAEEKWARTFEAYIAEGKAPTGRLEPAFNRFMAWMRVVYRNITAALNIKVTPEIKEVMDRMLATDREIEAARDAPENAQLFTSAEEMGVDEETFQKYITQAQAAVDAAKQAMERRMFDDLRRQRSKEYRERAKPIADAARRELRADKVQNIIRWLATGTTWEDIERPETRARFDRKQILDRYGKDVVDAMERHGKLLTDGRDLMDGELLAEAFGYSSLDQLVQEIVNAPEIEGEIRQRTLTGLAQQFPDAENDGARRAEFVSEALMNDQKGELLETEARALSRKAGIRSPVPSRILRNQARRAIAEMTVADARRVGFYENAERRNARAAEQMIRKGDLRAAAEYKRRQLAAHWMGVEAALVRQNEEKLQKLAAKYNRQKGTPTVDGKYRQQIRQLFAKLGLSTLSTQETEALQTMTDFLGELGDTLDAVDIPDSVLAGIAGDPRSITAQELADTLTAVQSLDHVGRKARKLEIAGRRIEFDTVVKPEILAEIAQAPQLGREENPRFKEATLGSRARDLMQIALGAMTRPEFIIDWLSNGNQNGPLRRYFWNVLEDAQNEKFKLRAQVSQKVIDLFHEVPPGYMNERLVVPSVGQTFSRAQLYAVALNMGSASNIEKMLEGEKQAGGHFNTPDILDDVARILSKEDWDRIQKIWDITNSLWPRVAALSKQIAGTEVKRVDAQAVRTPYGTYKGGYYPLAYDAELSMTISPAMTDEQIDRTIANGSYYAPRLQDGFLHVRNKAGAKPIKLDLSVLTQHLENVIHTVTHWEAVRSANMVLRDPDIRAAIYRANGRQDYIALRFMLNRVINASFLGPRGSMDRIINGVRSNMVTAALGFRLTTAFSQLAGLAPILPEVSKGSLVNAMSQIVTSPKATFDFVIKNSPEIQERWTERDADLKIALARSVTKGNAAYESWKALQHYAFVPISLMDRVVSTAGWLAAYRDALNAGKTEAEAIRAGDRVVRRSQGAATPMNTAQILTERGFQGLFTMFMSYFNVVFNQTREISREARTGNYLSAMSKTMGYIILPAVVGALLTGRLPGEGDDDADKDYSLAVAKWTGQQVATQMLAGIPGIRDLSSALISGRPPTVSPLQRLFEDVYKTSNYTRRALTGEKFDKAAAARSAINTVGGLTGIPLGQLATSTHAAIKANEEHDRQGIDLARDLLFGRSAAK